MNTEILRRLQEWEQYEQSRDKCQWNPSPETSAAKASAAWLKTGPETQNGTLRYNYWGSTHEWKQSRFDGSWFQGPKTGPAGASMPKLVECHVGNSFGHSWTFQRLGPLYGEGGFDWHSLMWFDVGGLSKTLARHKQIQITAKYLGPVMTGGNPAPYPPLHLHYAHLRMASNVREGGIEWESHADTACSTKDGGARCFYEMLPPGHGLVVMEPLVVDAEINDVRREGSRRMTFYFEVGLRWTTKPLLPAAMLTVGNLGPARPSSANLQRVEVYDTPTERASVMWYSTTMVRSLTFTSTSECSTPVFYC